MPSTDTNHLLTVSPAPATQLAIHTEPSATATAGQNFATQPVVYVEDQYGDLETEDNSTIVTVSPATGSGPLHGTISVTVVNGVATFTNLSDDTAGTITLDFASYGLTAATSTPISVSPAAASKLVVTQEPSATATAGKVFGTQPVVEEEDQFGNVITTDNTTTVTASRGNVGTSTLQGSNLTVTLSSGVAAFGGLFYDKAETINLSFTSSASGVSPVTSTDITVSPAAAGQLVIAQQTFGTATAGQAFPTQPVIDEEDQFNNIETGDNSTTITAELDTGAGPLQGTATIAVSGGVASFTNLADNTAETITLKFSGGGFSSIPSDSIAISPATASKLVVTGEPSTTATAGQPFTIQPVVTEEDQYANVVKTDSTSTVTVSTGSVGTATLQGSNLTVTLVNGVATFSGLFYDKAEPMNLNFTSSASGVSSAPSNNIVVSPVAANGLVIAQQPSATAAVGLPFSVQPVVDEVDQFGNIETGDNTTVVTAKLASGSGSLQGTTTATVSGGIVNFTNLYDSSLGTISLKFTGDGFTSTATDSIVVGPAAASNLVIHAQPSSTASAGQPFATQPVVYLVDQYGDLETGDNSTVVRVSLASGAGPLQGTASVTVNGGIATFSGLYDDTAETITLVFKSGMLPAATSGPITVAAGPASQLIVKRPPSAIVAGVGFGLEVDAEDTYGNLATSYSGPVTVGIASGPGTLTGTDTVSAASGVATFTNLITDTSGSITLGASASNSGNNLTSPTTSSITVSPAAAYQLAIHAQPSSSATAGAAFAIQPVIYEQDQFGNLETGDSSTVVTASPSAGSAQLQGTSVTLTGGVAVFTDLTDDTASTVTLKFVGGGFTSAPSAPIAVSPAAAYQLMIHTQPSSSATAGQPFATQPVIYEEDQFGNLETGDNSTVVTASAAAGSAQLASASVTLSGGMATFTDLADDTAGTVNLSFAGGGFTSAPSAPIAVSPAAAYQLVIHLQPSSSAKAGQQFAIQPVIYEEDRFGNLETGDSSTVVTASPSGAGSAQLEGTSVTLTAGVATFTGLADNTAGILTLNFTGGGFTSAPSASIAVSPAAAYQLVIHTQPSPTATAGQPFATQPVIYEEDQFGNLETGDSTTVVTASPSGARAAQLEGTSMTLTGGVATFTDLADDTAGTATLDFAGGGLTSRASDPIVVSHGAPYQLVIQTQPSSTATAGQPFATQPVIYEEDQYGNIDTSDNSSVVLVSLTIGAGVGPLQGTISAKVMAGVATFTNLADDTAETISLSFSDGYLKVGPSRDIVVAPAAVTQPVVEHLAIHTEPSSTATAGQAFATGPVIYIEDQKGNLETTDNSTVVTVSLKVGDGPLHGTESVTAEGGIATFNNLYDDLAETITLEFQSGSLPALTSSPIHVVAAQATKLAIVAQPPGAITAGAGFGLQVAAEDPFGNVDKTFTGPVTVVLGTNPGGSTLGGPATVTAVSGIATFSGLSLNKAGTAYTLKVSSGSLTAATTNPFSVAAGLAPIVSAEKVVPTYKLNKKGKPQGKPIAWAFELEYSTPMAATAGLASNYQILAMTTQRGKTSLTPVTFTETYNKANNTVTLTVSGKNPFAKGGQVNILASSPSGVSSQAGVLLNSKYITFTIAPGATGITLG